MVEGSDLAEKVRLAEGLLKAPEERLRSTSLAALVAEFVRVARERPDFALELATHFLVVAAALVQVKLASFLGDEEEESEEDLSFDELLVRLYQLEAFRAAADAMQEMMRREALSVAHPGSLDHTPQVPPLLSDVAPEDVAAALARVIERLPEDPFEGRVAPLPGITVEEACEEIMRYLSIVGPELNLAELRRRAALLTESVAYFVAALVLFKEGQVLLEQERAYGDVYVKLPVRDDGGTAKEAGTAEGARQPELQGGAHG
jgi:segregation and condensation protein A